MLDKYIGCLYNSTYSILHLVKRKWRDTVIALRGRAVAVCCALGGVSKFRFLA